MYHKFLFISLLLSAPLILAMQQQGRFFWSQPKAHPSMPLGIFLEKAQRMGTVEDTVRHEIDALTSTTNLEDLKEQLLTIQRYNSSEPEWVNDLHEHTLANLTTKFGADSRIKDLAIALRSVGAIRWLNKNRNS